MLAIGLAVAGIGVPVLAGALARSTGRRHATARGELTGDLVELLRGAPELVLYGRENDRLEAVHAADRTITQDARRDSLVAGLGSGLLVLVAGLTTVGVLAAAVSAHASGDLDRVLVAAVTLLALASFEGVVPLPGAAQELNATTAAGRRVLELIDTRPLISDPTIAAREARSHCDRGPRVGDGTLLAARAAGARRVRSRARAGRRVALVGESGAGKTTVTNLLFRFLDPASGCVTIGGCDIREMRQKDVRATFALAGQEAHVFNSTIRENLLLARPGAAEEELVAVAASAFGSPSGSRPSRSASTRSWERRVRDFRADSVNDSFLRGRSSSMRRCSSSTNQRPISTPRQRQT